MPARTSPKGPSLPSPVTLESGPILREVRRAMKEKRGRVPVILAVARGADALEVVHRLVKAVGRVPRVRQTEHFLAAELSAKEIEKAAQVQGVFKVWLNRPVRHFLDESRATVVTARRAAKGGDGRGVRVAVVDSGVDWTHPALTGAVERRLDLVEKSPALRGEHAASELPPRAPAMHPHGTHVAGIVASRDARYRGIAPGAAIVDVRVLGPDGSSDSFAVIEGLDWLRRKNEASRGASGAVYAPVANMSLGSFPEVDNYAVGFSPVCEESTRLVESGCLVVAAAGNEGFEVLLAASGKKAEPWPAFLHSTIGDPANARAVLAVGSTHKRTPMKFGVSYFSSRGPTAAGDAKPELVAPGEKIVSAVPGGRFEAMSGTSMASPHVAGAAALLIAREPRLSGNPEKLRARLLKGAKDLGRDVYFQGAGLVQV